MLRALIARIRWFVDHALLLKGGSKEDEEAFRRHADMVTASVSRIILALGPVGAFLWWPTDFLIYPDDPGMRSKMLLWRVGTIVTLGPPSLLITYSERVRRRPVPVVVTFVALGCAQLAFSFSRMGSCNTPWFGALYLLPLTTLMLQVPFLKRLALSVLMSVVMFVAFFAPNPAYLEPPAAGNVIGLLCFTILLSVALGHTIYHLVRMAFLAERSLARTNDQLEEQVRLKTADLRSLADRLETLREQERSEIARELHDDVGQLLAAIRFEVDMLGKKAARAGLELRVEDVHFLLDRMLDTFRRILRSLRPRALDDFGFVAAAEWLANEHRDRTGIEVQLKVTPPDLLVEGATATAAYRVLQEALTNTSRHAYATRVAVEIWIEGGALRLTVQDNGRGIPARGSWRPGAMGVIGMRERARILGGETEVMPAKEGGTVVTLRLPFGSKEGSVAA